MTSNCSDHRKHTVYKTTINVPEHYGYIPGTVHALNLNEHTVTLRYKQKHTRAQARPWPTG